MLFAKFTSIARNLEIACPNGVITPLLSKLLIASNAYNLFNAMRKQYFRPLKIM
jgi:hypothetical protein